MRDMFYLIKIKRNFQHFYDQVNDNDGKNEPQDACSSLQVPSRPANVT